MRLSAAASRNISRKKFYCSKNIKNKYEGWVLSERTVEPGETHEETALREVLEESGSRAFIVDYVGKVNIHLPLPEDVVAKRGFTGILWCRQLLLNRREEYFAVRFL